MKSERETSAIVLIDETYAGAGVSQREANSSSAAQNGRVLLDRLSLSDPPVWAQKSKYRKLMIISYPVVGSAINVGGQIDWHFTSEGSPIIVPLLLMHMIRWQ